MPLWGDSNKGENYKAKLEHKMCIVSTYCNFVS